MKRDNNAEGVYEWFDTPVDQERLSLIKAVVASKEAKLRLEGQNRAKDREITEHEKQAMRLVLQAFETLTEKTSH